MISPEQRDLLTLCAIRYEDAGPDWNLVARIAQSPRGLDLLKAGEVPEDSRAARLTLPILRGGLENLETAITRVVRELEHAERVGAKLTTVLDDDYPANLRLVPDLPPFLFYRGTLETQDAYSIAVVGTRQVSDDGCRRAKRMARELVEHGVRVYSGLARGVDTAVHTAALDADGRTLAVVGTGITRCYPPENSGLAERIVQSGAVFSQFWPSASPAKWTFPRRNVVMSGLTQATCVIEASSTSGAKLQARCAYEHGKQVFLVRSLVQTQPWAARMLEQGKAVEVDDVGVILKRMAEPNRVIAASAGRQQLALDVL